MASGMRAAIYIRTSAEERDVGQNDPAIQREKCEAMAILKGWEVAGIYIDEGLSGSLAEEGRSGLAELIDAFQGEEAEVAIVASLDRLATNIHLALSTILQITGLGAVFVSCSEGFDSSTPTGQFVLDMFSHLADLEHLSSSSIDEGAAWDELHSYRKPLPLGYIRGSEGPEIDVISARIVRRIFELRGDGYSLEEIAKWMGFEGIVPPTGEQWTPSGIKSVLDDGDKYRGGFQQNSEERWPPILSN